MAKAIAAMIGVLLLVHGALGLFIEGRHVILFTVDLPMDLLHLAAALVLLLASRASTSARAVRTALLIVAVVFAGVGMIGLADPELGGFAPTGLIVGDFAVCFGVAGAALLGAIQPRAARPAWADQLEGSQIPVPASRELRRRESETTSLVAAVPPREPAGTNRT